MAQHEKETKGKHSCPVCGQSFNSEQEQREHQSKQHQGRPESGQSYGEQRRDQSSR